RPLAALLADGEGEVVHPGRADDVAGVAGDDAGARELLLEEEHVAELDAGLGRRVVLGRGRLVRDRLEEPRYKGVELGVPARGLCGAVAGRALFTGAAGERDHEGDQDETEGGNGRGGGHGRCG